MVVPPIGAIRGVETNYLRILVESLSMRNCLLQILLSNALTLKSSFGATYQLQTTITTPNYTLYHNRATTVVVVVVINASYPSLSLRNRTIWSKLQPSTTKMVLCINAPWKTSSRRMKLNIHSKNSTTWTTYAILVKSSLASSDISTSSSSHRMSRIFLSSSSV